MSLAELMSGVRSLSKGDKLRLIQLVAQDLAEADRPPAFVDGQSYPVWSPTEAFAAADALLRALAADRSRP